MECHRSSDLRYGIGSKTTQRGFSSYHWYGVPTLPTSEASVMRIISPLEGDTPRQFLEEIFLFNSEKQDFSLLVPRHGLVFRIRSVRGVDE